MPGVVQAGIVTLALNEGAYMAEIMRAAIDSVDKGQAEAAESLGMRRRQAMRHVVLAAGHAGGHPAARQRVQQHAQGHLAAERRSGLQELFLAAQDYNSATFRTFEIFLVAALYYIAMTTIWSFIQAAIERRLQARGGDVRDERAAAAAAVRRRAPSGSAASRGLRGAR